MDNSTWMVLVALLIIVGSICACLGLAIFVDMLEDYEQNPDIYIGEIVALEDCYSQYYGYGIKIFLKETDGNLKKFTCWEIIFETAQKILLNKQVIIKIYGSDWLLLNNIKIIEN